MHLAAIDSWIWVIIFVVVAISKMWSQFQQPADDDEQPAEPVATKPPPKLPAARTIQRGPPAPPPPLIEEKWGEAPKSLRDFMEQMRRQMEPPPPVVKAKPVAAPLPVAKPVAPPIPKSAPVSAVVVPKPARAAPWVAALRDKRNVRNIIIGAEVLGPPKGADWR
jgi:hypothetical protein